MALIKFGMMMTDARGKLGGQVFTKTRSGATIRTKVTPANPNTSAQSLARSRFGLISSEWRLLDEADRATWNSAVSNYSKTNIFGDTYLPSGKNLFVSLNSNLLSVGISSFMTAPLPVSVPSLLLTTAEVVVVDEEINLTYTGSEPGLGYSKVIEATAPFSAGKYNFTGGFARISQWNGTSEPLPTGYYIDYVNKYGNPPPGTKIAFRACVIVNATGQKSPYSEVTTIVV